MTTRKSKGPLGDGPSFAYDVTALEAELDLAARHPEFDIDVPAVQAALREAKADAAKSDDPETGPPLRLEP